MKTLVWIKAKWQALTFWTGVGSIIIWKVIVPAGNMLIDIHDTIQAEGAFKVRVVNYIEADSVLKSDVYSKLNLTSGKIDIVLKNLSSHLTREKMSDDRIRMQEEIIRMQEEQIINLKKN